jgi:predicted SAM-dependent methyltransferase
LSPEAGLSRLNWGCGTDPEPGWINSDIKEAPGIDLSADILQGLPLEKDSVDYAVSIHALPELRYPDQVPALMELRRVLAPGGVLRLVLPDLDRAIRAYQADERDYFLIPDSDAREISSKMIVQLLWYGYSKTLFTFDFISELLERAGFREIHRCSYQQTASHFEEIVSLDNRPEESLFVEARK